MNILNQTETEDIPVSCIKLRAIADRILADYEFPEGYPSFTVLFVTPEEIRRLNRTFRSVDAVTDVLSFESGGEKDPRTKRPYLGDIAVCLDRAAEQAKLSGHKTEDEVCLLVIHGLLHLLGYDHDTDEKKAIMWEEQNLYLDVCGVRINRRPGEDFDF